MSIVTKYRRVFQKSMKIACLTLRFKIKIYDFEIEWALYLCFNKCKKLLTLKVYLHFCFQTEVCTKLQVWLWRCLMLSRAVTVELCYNKLIMYSKLLDIMNHVPGPSYQFLHKYMCIIWNNVYSAYNFSYGFFSYPSSTVYACIKYLAGLIKDMVVHFKTEAFIFVNCTRCKSMQYSHAF